MKSGRSQLDKLRRTAAACSGLGTTFARLVTLESPENPVCLVTGPGLPESVWHGVYGGAKVRPGDVCEAITSDGVRHPLRRSLIWPRIAWR
jgi:hypothetical protein